MVRHRQHPHKEHFIWMDNRCRFCKKFIKSKGSYGHPKYCIKCYKKLKGILDREYQHKILIRSEVENTIKSYVPEYLSKHLHWKRFIRRFI